MQRDTVARVRLNKPVEGGTDHWVVIVEEQDPATEIAQTTSEIPLVEGAILRIGRASSNDIVIRSKLASRFHALISVTRNGVIVCDLDSLNGSFVNGYRVSAPQDISSGDTLRIGPVEFHVAMNVERRESQENTAQANAQFESVEVVILLADMVDYRERLAASSPEILTPILRQWFADVREIVASNDGVIDRFLGDGVIAMWIGTQEDRSQMIQRALRTAGQLQTRTNDLSPESDESGPWQCSVVLGLSSALMSARDVVAPGALVLGSAMNEVFAISASMKREDVLLSCNAKAAEELAASCRLEQRTEIETPAVLGDSVQAFEILGPK